MTDAIDEVLEEVVSVEQQAIGEEARSRRGTMYTPSVLQAATAAFTDVLATLVQHDISDSLMDQGRSFAGQILEARSRAYAIGSFYVGEEIEPLVLLQSVVSAAAAHLGRSLEPTEGPALNKTRAEIAYVVLPRQPESPAWGPDGEAPLVISLGQEDLAAANAAASSGAPIIGPYRPGPWTWNLGHSTPGSFFMAETSVIAPPPSSEVATEIGVLVAGVLINEMPLRP